MSKNQLLNVKLPIVTIQKYLKQLKIKPDEVLIPSYQTLNKIFQSHLNTYPYEALDVASRKNPQSLLKIDLVNRLLDRSRGGYCFLLVGAFSSLLSSLGYKVTLHRGYCSAIKDRLDLTWREAESASVKQSTNHVVCVVHIDNKKFVVDVGLGDGPNLPFELPNSDSIEWQLVDGRKYKLNKIDNVVWRWYNHPNAVFEGMDFEIESINNTMEAYHTAFLEKHIWYHDAKETSPFYKPSIFRTSQGGVLLHLVGTKLRQLIETKNDTDGDNQLNWIVVKEAKTMEEWIRMIEIYFGLKLNIDFTTYELKKLWNVTAESINKDKARL